MEKFFPAPVANFADLLMDAVCMVDAAGRFVFASAACERIFGYTAEEMRGRTMIDMVAPEDRERTLAAARTIMDGQPNLHFENRYVRKDGSLVHLLWSARWSEQHQLRVAVARDISAAKRAEATQAALYAISEAAHATDDLPQLFQHIHQIIGGLLPAACFVVALHDSCSDQLRFAYHADQQGPLPQSLLARVMGEEVRRMGRPLLLDSSTLAGLPEALRSAAGLAPVSWLGVPLTTSQGPIGVLMLQGQGEHAYTDADRDLLLFVSTQVATAIQRKRMHAQLRFMAQHDELTRLPNRRLFHDRLETAFARAQRQQGRLSLLFIDLDKFKLINDEYGHASGDLLLKEVAWRIQACVRESDTVARIGGDEFVVILENVGLPDHALAVKDKIHEALALPVPLADRGNLQIAASIGVAHYPDHGADMQQLLRHADNAMYASKTQPAPM
ncbi:diguanylate cyclase [Duganella sp. LX20W]|uniref:Diguanylate cyclase n=1 Tax=Rugamonas brunnea TaxID=2758569 RepID=A0A7W2ETE1_9BURK|nr:diguanylate cyclase [Rugamonas brunnea]MBA5638271.1 diguanylate cyclase [Rugamonas brunnea]